MSANPAPSAGLSGFVRLLRVRWRVFLACGFVGFTCGLALTLLQVAGGRSPWLGLVADARYRATAILEIHPPAVDAGREGAARPPLPYSVYLDSEMAKIRLHGVLGRVVDRLDLTKSMALDRDSLVWVLRENTTVSRVADGGLVEITAEWRDPVMARDIAEAIACEFRGVCAESDVRETEIALDELRKQIRIQEDSMEQSRKLLATIVKVKDIVYPGDSVEWNPPSTAETSARVRMLEARVALLDKAAADPSLALAIDTPDNPVRAIYPKYNALRSRSETDNKGEDAARELESLSNQLADGVKRLRTEAVAALELAKIEKFRLIDEVRELRKEKSAEAMDRRDYQEAKDTFEAETVWLGALKARFNREEAEARLRPGRVRVIEAPVVPSRRTYRENRKALSLVPGNAAWGTAAGLLFGLLVAVVLEARASSGKRARMNAAIPDGGGDEF
ncbi:MAG: hypothetical protein J0M04_20385 [Verrucomicrobia bacterium]|nr:hypothetical protein [Verrucomicrobiota bacterium]